MDETQPRAFRWSLIVTVLGVFLCVGITVGGVAAMLWPHDSVVLDLHELDGPYRPGELAVVPVHYCNPGFTIEVAVWLDYFANPERTEDDPGPRVSAQVISTREFFPVRAVSDGCRDVSVDVALPDDLPSGQYRLRAEASWQPNPVRADALTSITDYFRVEKP